MKREPCRYEKREVNKGVYCRECNYMCYEDLCPDYFPLSKLKRQQEKEANRFYEKRFIEIQ